MQISDLVSQFHNKAAGTTRAESGVRELPKHTEAVRNLQPGQTFEGSVSGMKGNQVTLTLANGQNINARLSDGVRLGMGESVFFEVRSNEGGMVQIRPVSFGLMNNPTIMNALEAAGLPKNEQNFNLVNTMMKEQMAIDAKSLSDMAKLLNLFPETDVDTVVTMKHYDIPVNKEMIAQFENYKANEGAIMNAVDEMVDSMAAAFSGEDVSAADVAAFQKTLIQTLQLSGEEALPEEAGAVPEEAGALSEEALSEGTGEAASLAEGTEEAEASRKHSAVEVLSESGKGAEALSKASGESRGMATEQTTLEELQNKIRASESVSESAEGKPARGLTEPAIKAEAEVLITGEKESSALKTPEPPRGSLGFVLKEDGFREIEQQLKKLPEIRENHPEFFDEKGQLKPETKVSDLLNAMTDSFTKSGMSKGELLKTIGSDSYKALVHDLMEDSWTVSPEELKKENKLQNLYEKLETHIRQIEETAKQLTSDPNNLITKAASNVRENIDFMNQLNQNLTYVQLPLKFANQNANGELYVYANRKNRMNDDGPLTAFLHFDLDHLGSTDISVKMVGKQVDTQFFMADDASYKLLAENIGALEQRLKDKGYNAKITVENDEQPKNVIRELEKNSGTKPVKPQRYSFDAKA